MVAGVGKPVQIGDVYLVDFSGEGSVQNGKRPALVIQNNIGNIHSPNTIILPITSVIKKISQPTHVYVSADSSGLSKDSVVLCENPTCVSKEALEEYLTTLPSSVMERVAVASTLATSVVSYVGVETLIRAWQKAVKFNQTV